MAITCQFVDQISASPTVRLDLNDKTDFAVLDEGRDFSPPSIRRSVAQTLLRDGAEIPASAYDNRVLTIPLYVKGATKDAVATNLQTLARELDRAKNLLKWSTGETNPVFFRTFRSDYDINPIVQQSGLGFTATLMLSILAEPFALGVRVDTGSTTINNDPAAGSNGHFVDVSSVTGDVTTPCVIYDPNEQRQAWIFGVRQHGTPSHLNFFTQAEDAGVTLLTDTTNPGGGPDAAMSGTGTNNYVRTSFATTTLVNRLRGPVAASGSSAGSTDDKNRALRGQYRVIVVVRRSDSSSVIKVQWRYGSTTDQPTSELVTVPTTTARQFLDMGLVTIGGTTPNGLGYAGVENPVASVELYWLAERVSGTGTLDWDYWFLIPADEQLMTIRWGAMSADLFIDGINEKVGQIEAGAARFDGTGSLHDGNTIVVAGSYPKLVPNQTNRFYLITSDTYTTSFQPAKSATQAWTFSYWPRFLYVRP